MEVYDMAGNLVEMEAEYPDSDRSTTFKVNSSNNLSPGIYIVRANAQGKDYTSKAMMRGTGGGGSSSRLKSRL